MKSYKVQNLTKSTSPSEQTKLISALKGVAGVADATLRLENSSIEIKAKEQQEPKHADLVAASQKAGFQLKN